MTSVNRVILVGHLGSDPVDRLTKDGRHYTTFSMATNRSWKNKGTGETEKRTDWHKVTVWGKKGENCQNYLAKGSPVCVEGALSTYEIEENGKKLRLTSVSADEVSFLSTRPKTDDSFSPISA